MRLCGSHSSKWHNMRAGGRRRFSELKESSGVRPPSSLFPLPRWRAGRVTHTEGSQQRLWQPGIKPQRGSATDWRAGRHMQRSVQAFIGPSPSHLSHKIGFVEALPSAEKAKVDYGSRRGWNGITSGMAPNRTPCCLNANYDWIMNDLCSLLSSGVWLEWCISNIFVSQKRWKTGMKQKTSITAHTFSVIGQFPVE